MLAQLLFIAQTLVLPSQIRTYNQVREIQNGSNGGTRIVATQIKIPSHWLLVSITTTPDNPQPRFIRMEVSETNPKRIVFRVTRYDGDTEGAVFQAWGLK